MTDKNTKALAAQYSLVASGYAGLDGEGNVVDRRENALATPVQKNDSLYVPAPKPVPLGKLNFWDKLKERYPVEVQDFYDWLERYQQEVNWTKLFYSPHAAANRDIRFFDIPVEMQVGVIMRFAEERNITLLFDVSALLIKAPACIEEVFCFFNTQKFTESHD